MTPDELIATLERSSELPQLSPVVGEILQACRNPCMSVRLLGELIECDAVLVGRTLRLVNSPFLGYARPITDIRTGIAVVGFDRTSQLVLASSLFALLATETWPEHFDLAALCEHALGVGIAAEVLARHLGSGYRREAFLAGLLHSAGKWAVARCFPKEYERIARKIRLESCLWADAERGVLPCGHAHVGGWLAAGWGLSAATVAAIRHHETPDSAGPHRELAYFVHAGDVFARALDLGDPLDPGMPRLERGAWEHCKMSEGMLDFVFDEILARHGQTAAFLEPLRGAR